MATWLASLIAVATAASLLSQIRWQVDKLLMPSSIVLGLIVGIIIPGSADLPDGYRLVSSMMGWTYFFMWAISFYPQAITNFQNKSTKGFNTDKVLYDMVGFGALSLYECSMFYVPSVRSEYAAVYDGKLPEVDINDVFFATHSFAVTIFIAGQMIYYDGYTNFPSETCRAVSGILTLAAAIGLCSVLFLQPYMRLCTMLNWLYLLSVVKVIITILKFLPQVRANIRRKSTQGWNIHGSNMDFCGAVLSTLQLFLDCYYLNDWGGVGGNFVKLGLALISGGYDALFAVQHYCLYPGTGDDYIYERQRAEEKGIELKYGPVSQSDSSMSVDQGGEGIETLCDTASPMTSPHPHMCLPSDKTSELLRQLEEQVEDQSDPESIEYNQDQLSILRRLDELSESDNGDRGDR